MARGRLRCLGTSLRLKARFGSGYRVSVRVAGSGGGASLAAAGAAAGWGSWGADPPAATPPQSRQATQGGGHSQVQPGSPSFHSPVAGVYRLESASLLVLVDALTGGLGGCMRAHAFACVCRAGMPEPRAAAGYGMGGCR
jgi:hypothetical protein